MNTAFILLMSFLAASAGDWPESNPTLNAQVCAERPENNGSLNIRPANVLIEGGPVLTLLGGQAACAYVEGGRTYNVWIQSEDPFHLESKNPTAWKSNRLKITVLRGTRAELLICGKGSKGTYRNWELRRNDAGCDD
jgi:hypothetical protein